MRFLDFGIFEYDPNQVAMVMYLRKESISFGVHVHPEGLSFEEVKALAQRAEQLGYDLFTLTDHFMNMEDSKRHENHPLECWATLSAIAAVTRKIQIGPLVSCAYYRQPTILAKMATTVDIISCGRLVLGLGAGWYKEEFEGFIGRFPSAGERLQALEEAAQICKTMFENEFTKFKGRIYSADNTLNSPRPVRGYIPVMIGGSGPKKTLRIQAKYADICHVWDHLIASELQERIETLKAHCKEVGRDFSTITVGTGLNVMLQPTLDEIKAEALRVANERRLSLREGEAIVRETVGSNKILETIKRYRNFGVQLITVVGLKLKDLETFKDEVVLKL